MSNSEMQDEEREVLLSIYDGDSAFKQISPNVFQYKLGEHEHIKSFLLELQWGENYPAEKPNVNMNIFYNRNLIEPIKNKVMDLISNEAKQFLGEAMTYSLIECVKEKYEDLIQDQPDSVVQEVNDAIEKIDISNKDESVLKKVVPKKEHLTKAQKRRQWDRVEQGKGERPRGWDWVDIVKHLSQTGPKEAPSPERETSVPVTASGS